MYRALLHLYPKSFRGEYEGEMCSVFSQRLRDASGFELVLLWIETFFDVLFNAIRVHLDILRQDLNYIGRTFRQSPGYALTVVGIAGLGIGATTAAFSITNHVLIRPLPFPAADRLVTVWEKEPNYSRLELSPRIIWIGRRAVNLSKHLEPMRTSPRISRAKANRSG